MHERTGRQLFQAEGVTGASARRLRQEKGMNGQGWLMKRLVSIKTGRKRTK